MAEITITVDEQELARAQERAREAGLSVEEWLRQLMDRTEANQDGIAPFARPRNPLFGWLADEPALADAIDAVVAERSERYKPRFDDL